MLELISISIATHVSPSVDLTGANTTTPPAGQQPRKPPKPTRWARPVNGGTCPQNLKQVCLELAKTTSPEKLCELRGGTWNGESCVLFIPQPNPAPGQTRGTGTRFREEMAFKPKPGRGVLPDSTGAGSRKPKNQAFYLFSPIG